MQINLTIDKNILGKKNATHHDYWPVPIGWIVQSFFGLIQSIVSTNHPILFGGEMKRPKPFIFFNPRPTAKIIKAV